MEFFVSLHPTRRAGAFIELREEYEDRLRTHGWQIWDKAHPRYEKMVQFCYHHHEPEGYEG